MSNSVSRVVEYNYDYTDILNGYNLGDITWANAKEQIEALNARALNEGVPFKVDPDTVKQVSELDTQGTEDDGSDDDYGSSEY